ncbi:MAG TPA: hypothetical protein VKN73_12710 [Desulfosalsimonadaceae bacterium]|nr:hypothetical protein [Desulfosalsimonadaceae bacterium]
MRRSALIFLCMSLLLAAGPAVCAAADTEPNCNIQEESCTQTVGGRTVELDITPKPVKAMEELTFRVSVSGNAMKKPPHIDLGMPAMEMGPNQVTMKKVSDSVYEGTGVIVRCPSGKTIWEAEVTVPGAGKASFIFDVVY